MSVVVRVEGDEAAAVTTAVAIESVRGRPFRAMVGAQVQPVRLRQAMKTSVIDTTLGQGGRGDAR